LKYASVIVRKDRPFLFISYLDPRSRQRVRVVTEFRRDDPRGRLKALELAREKSKEALADSHAAPGLWDSWVIDHLTLRYLKKIQTLGRELTYWKVVRAYLDEKRILSPRGLDYNLAVGYLAWRKKHVRKSKKTIAHNTALAELKALGRLMREAVRRGFCASNPCDSLEIQKDAPAEKPEITDEEIIAIRAELARREGALPLRERWMTISFEIALHQGCRFAETCLPMSAVDLERGTIKFHAKRDVIFTALLHPELRPLLVALKAAGATHTYAPRDRGEASREWHRFFHGREGEGKWPHLCFHCTRVTVVTRLARAGVPQQQAMAFVHHADELIHKIYLRLKPEDGRLCVEALRYPLLDTGGGGVGSRQIPGGGAATS